MIGILLADFFLMFMPCLPVAYLQALQNANQRRSWSEEPECGPLASDDQSDLSDFSQIRGKSFEVASGCCTQLL